MERGRGGELGESAGFRFWGRVVLFGGGWVSGGVLVVALPWIVWFYLVLGCFTLP
jgi:hypothetical protein